MNHALPTLFSNCGDGSTFPNLMEEAFDGKIWFGLTNGVISYDGINWTDYTATEGAPKSSIKTICPTEDGSVYIGSESEMTKFSGQKW